jgi:hypothetical protein
MIINQIAIPNKLNLFGKTLGNSAFGYLELWKLGLQAFYFFKVNVQVLGILRQKGYRRQSGRACFLCR